MEIPKELRGQVQTLTFEIIPNNLLDLVRTRVRIDNIALRPDYLFQGRTGDLILVDLRAVDGGTQFHFLDAVGQVSANAAGTRFVITSASGAPVGEIILSDEVEGLPFAETGRLYFAPDTRPDGDSPGFQGELVGSFSLNGPFGDERKFTIDVGPDFSGSGPNAVTYGQATADLLRIQQRLKYLGYPGFGGLVNGDYLYQGRTGDVIKVNLGRSGGASFQIDTIDGAAFSPNASGVFQLPSNRGTVVLGGVATGQTSFQQTGVFYFLPNPDAGFTNFDPAQGFQGNISGKGRINGQPVEFLIQVFKNFSDKLEPGPIDTPLEILQVEQRLRFFGFPAFDDTDGNGFANDASDPTRLFDFQSVAVTGALNGKLPAATRWAMSVFKAAIGMPVDPDDPTAGTINTDFFDALNAPSWVELKDESQGGPSGLKILDALEDGPTSGGQQPERWATSYAAEILAQASANWVAIRTDQSAFGAAIRQPTPGRRLPRLPPE